MVLQKLLSVYSRDSQFASPCRVNTCISWMSNILASITPDAAKASARVLARQLVFSVYLHEN